MLRDDKGMSRSLTFLSVCVALAQDPAQLTTQEDHKRTMGLLGITGIRRGADGRNADAPNAANYDESKTGSLRSMARFPRQTAGSLSLFCSRLISRRRLSPASTMY